MATTPATEPIVLPASSGTDVRRQELGAFLRSRRERIKPEEIGLRSSRRRRTPGLRREEVAQLAGVGITWYTWLEQGRDIRPSAQVLEAIARTLQFDSHEHQHLFTLAGIATTTIADHCLDLCPTAYTVLDQLEPFPASVINDRFDLIAYNRVCASFYDDLDSIPIEDRNCMWLSFTHPGWRRAIVDWDEAVGRMVGEYRAAMAEHIDEPAWKALVTRLQHASPEFAAMWERHDVHSVETRTKRLLHPTAGRFDLEATNLWLGQRLGTRIVVLTASDVRTRLRLEALTESLRAA